MLFNERHSICLCSVSNLLDPLLGGGSEPAPSHLGCEDKNTLTAGPKLCKDIVCTCNLTAGKRKLWFHWSWLEWWFRPPAPPIWASSSLQEKSGVEILAEADAAAFWRMCPPGLALVSTQRLRLSLERVFLIVTKSLRLGKKSFLRVNRFD